MVQWVGKWGLREVDLDPYHGFVHLGYTPIHTTTHRVVWMVLLGHGSDMRHDTSNRQVWVVFGQCSEVTHEG